MTLPKLKNLFVSETCLRFFAIDPQISVLVWRLHPKKFQTISETHANWSQFCAVSEAWGLAITTLIDFIKYGKMSKRK